MQMTTDTAVRVTRLVVEGQSAYKPVNARGQEVDHTNKITVPLEKIPYVDFPEIKVSKNETTEMPFRYVKNDDGSPVMPEVSIKVSLICLKWDWRLTSNQGMLDLIKEDSKKGVLDMV